MRALIIGSGAREHALAWKISQSPLLEKLYLYGANDGFSHLGTLLNAKNYKDLAQIALSENINIVIVGPEQPLAEGIYDIFRSKNISCIGASKFWANLESSKSFAKKFMQKHGIKTAKYQIIQNENTLPNLGYPLVLKADGLCGGKGVCIAQNQIEAKSIIKEYLNGKFGKASEIIVAEEFLEGNELSLINLFDGKTLLPLLPTRDFKKLQNDDIGPNTGGMGAFCPVNLTSEQNQKLKSLKNQIEKALIEDNADFTGVLYAGLIWVKNDFYVLEFNMRFGDPETQALMVHLESDILEIFDLCTKKQLKNAKLKWKKDFTGCLVIASKGYPENFTKGVPIGKIPDESEIFYAGVKKQNELLSDGGRVLSICNTDKNPYGKIYNIAKNLEFSEKYYRTDINIC